MIFNEDHFTFKEIDSKQKGTARRCIDGVMTGRNLCVGYCNYTQHPGFLTVTQIQTRLCKEKNCVYFAPKDKISTFSFPELNPEKELLKLAKKETDSFVGIRFLNCTHHKGKYRLTFVAIASYDLAALCASLQEKSGLKLELAPIACDFETAQHYIFNKKEELLD